MQPGAYYVQINALRPFGNIDADDDYQVWKSPSFTIRSVNITVLDTIGVPAFNSWTYFPLLLTAIQKQYLW